MKKALLVIDYINGIARDGACASYLTEHPQVIHNTNELMTVAREQEMLIIHVRLAFDEDYLGLPQYAPMREVIKHHQKFLIGTDETAFIDAINRHDSDIVVNKQYGDPFHGGELLAVLNAHQIETLIFTGIATDNAILNGANSAMLNNFEVVVITDACGATTQEAHDKALGIMKNRSVNAFFTTQAFLEKI